MQGRVFRFLMSRKQRQKQHHGPIYKYCIHPPDSTPKLFPTLCTQTGAQLLFQVCSALYERVAVIITTNLRFAEWSTIMGGDERMSAALLDRLTHKATILEFVGTSYRFRQQLQHQDLSVIEAKEPVAAEPVEA